jgi:hypothetical protein
MVGVPIRREQGTNDAGMTMDMVLRMVCTALSSRVRSGDEHNSVDTRRCSRRRRAQLHMAVCRNADRRDPCRRHD